MQSNESRALKELSRPGSWTYKKKILINATRSVALYPGHFEGTWLRPGGLGRVIEGRLPEDIMAQVIPQDEQ